VFFACYLLACYSERTNTVHGLCSGWLDYSVFPMSYGKRETTSPRENMAKNSRSNIVLHETEPEKLFKIELCTINGKPFLGQISDDELLYIWVLVFKRKLEDLFGVTSS
jgi:hypothetical protein